MIQSFSIINNKNNKINYCNLIYNCNSGKEDEIKNEFQKSLNKILNDSNKYYLDPLKIISYTTLLVINKYYDLRVIDVNYSKNKINLLNTIKLNYN